jgi:hypothetical protein
MTMDILINYFNWNIPIRVAMIVTHRRDTDSLAVRRDDTPDFYLRIRSEVVSGPAIMTLTSLDTEFSPVLTESVFADSTVRYRSGVEMVLDVILHLTLLQKAVDGDRNRTYPAKLSAYGCSTQSPS